MAEPTRYNRNAGYIGIAVQEEMGVGVAPTHYIKYSGATSQTPTQDYTRYVEGGDGQYSGFTVKHLHKPDGNFEAFARPDIAGIILGLLLGKQVSTGTATAGTDTTLSAAAARGDTTISVTSATGYVAGDFIQIGVAGSTEVREIDSILIDDITLTAPLGMAHDSGDAVEEVIAPVTHTLTPSEQHLLPWATLERSIAGVLVNRFTDVRIQSVNITGEAGQPITMAVNYRGIDEEKQVAAGTAVYESNDPFIFYQGTYTVDAADVSAMVTNFNMNIVNTLDEADQTDEQVRAHIPLVRRDVEISWTQKFKDGDLYADTYLGGLTTPAGSIAEGGTFSMALAYGSGTSERGLTIAVPNVYMTRAEVELDAGSGESQQYSCEGHAFKGVGAELLTVTVKNGEGALYA